ncbi:outer-membrane lipoprotein carrier protein LolA [Aliifodinibius salicampi]|uniref:Outer-membrane lipoprotein carrier protein LolA n=1 Tax=Fodinibius salicampi TaxID=1920655 RepID=A0ABT3Q2M6_9BACT|nr:outer-membrane lipoprotein carrier protein LolA [Fodinibius salicampi]MCW9714352.1 outer-membrane lipoprotein carrier protein LolA [Fodinibius salicampi]
MSDRLVQFLITALLLGGIPVMAGAQDAPFEQLKMKFEDGQIFSADFHHQSVDSYTQDTVSNNGLIWVGNEDYKVRTDQQTVVVDGKISTVFDRNRNRVIISNYEPSEDDFAPSRILNGIDSTFTVTEEMKQGNQFYIQLTSEDPFAIYKKVEIVLSEALIPQQIRAVDPVDNIITTEFKNGTFLPPEEELFELDYPDSVELIDMRD